MRVRFPYSYQNQIQLDQIHPEFLVPPVPGQEFRLVWPPYFRAQYQVEYSAAEFGKTNLARFVAEGGKDPLD